MMEILSARQVQPGIFDRLNTTRGKEQSANNNFDLFSKTNSRESIGMGGRFTKVRPSPLNINSPLQYARRCSPSPINVTQQNTTINQEDSWFMTSYE